MGIDLEFDMKETLLSVSDVIDAKNRDPKICPFDLSSHADGRFYITLLDLQGSYRQPMGQIRKVVNENNRIARRAAEIIIRLYLREISKGDYVIFTCPHPDVTMMLKRFDWCIILSERDQSDLHRKLNSDTFYEQIATVIKNNTDPFNLGKIASP